MPDLGPAPFAPHVLREYALLADGERGVLIGPAGECAWMCAPRWDSDAVFAALIGGAGGFAVTPAARFVWGGYYEADTLIWRSRWATDVGIVECREALAFPGDPHRAVLLRRIIAVSAEAQVEVSLDVRAHFGRHRMTDTARHGGTWTARTADLRVRLIGVPHARVLADGTLRATISVPAAAHHDLVLEVSDRTLPTREDDPDVLWQRTEQAWSHVVPPITDSIAPRAAAHAYAVLRGLTAATGGMVAAATTSLPERAERGRNYDYRYVWIRDQCFAGQAVAVNGPGALLDDAVRFVSARVLEHGPDLRPAYTVRGAAVPDQHDLDLPGYPGGGARIGNWVTHQFQLDTFGEALLLFRAAGRLDRLEHENWRAVELCVDAIARRWHEPDAGIWELSDARWAHSRLSCAAGLRAAADIAPRAQAARWSALADTIVADAAADCTHPSGRWQRAPRDSRVDCALLLAAVRGAVPADDPRSIATLEAIRAELADDYYVYRFRQDERPLADAEGAFLFCGFVTALALQQRGSPVAAARWFERNRGACGPPRLYTEEYDIAQGQLRGNLPQAFVHALMFEASCRLGRPWVTG